MPVESSAGPGKEQTTLYPVPRPEAIKVMLYHLLKTSVGYRILAGLV